MNDVYEIEGFFGLLESCDCVCFWCVVVLDGFECFFVIFWMFEFVLYMYEIFCIGVIEVGVQKLCIWGFFVSVGVGMIYFINLDVIYEGCFDVDGYCYCMMYFSVEVLCFVVEDVVECDLLQSFIFLDEMVLVF